MRSYGEKAANRKLAATFAITEHQGAKDVEVMRGSCIFCDIQLEASDAGMVAAKRWLDSAHPET